MTLTGSNVSVAVTGLGVVSTLGCSVEDLARAFLGDGARLAPRLEEGALTVPEIPLAAVPVEKRPRIGRLDRLCRMFLAASYLATDAAGLVISPDEAERVGLSFGTGLGCLLTNEEYYRKVVEQGPAAASPRLFAYTVSSAAAGEVSIALGIKGPNVTAHMGFAAGLGALGYGFDLIQMGKADVVLAGGADVTGPALVQGLRDMGLLKGPNESRPFRDAVAGVLPSEGAVVAVLERDDRARARGARSWGRVRGYAAGFEPTLTRKARDDTGISATMRRALDLAGRRPGDVDLLLASTHGTPIDGTERDAQGAVFGRDSDVLVIAPKALLGETFGAGGALALALAAGLTGSVSCAGASAAGPERVAPPAGSGTVSDGEANRRLPVFDVLGRPLDPAMAERRLPACSVVMVNSVCYSGNIVSLLFDREG